MLNKLITSLYFESYTSRQDFLRRIRITLMRIRMWIQLLTLLRIRIRILLLAKVMRIFDNWPADIQASILSVHASILSVDDSPRLHFEPRKLQNLTLMRIRFGSSFSI
jgi:hypothetical protein